MPPVDSPLPRWKQILAGAWLVAVTALFLRQVVLAYLAALGV